jgi:hypothetical protein
MRSNARVSRIPVWGTRSAKNTAAATTGNMVNRTMRRSRVPTAVGWFALRHAGDIAHGNCGGAEDHAIGGRAGRRDDRGQHEDREARRRVVLQQREQHRALDGRVAEDAAGGQRDQRIRDADERVPAAPTKQARRATSGEHAEDPPHESISMTSPMPSATSVAQLTVAPSAELVSCPRSNGPHALRHDDAVADGDPAEQRGRADHGDHHLHERRVGVGEHAAGQGVGEHDGHDQQHAHVVARAEEPLEQEAAGVPGLGKAQPASRMQKLKIIKTDAPSSTPQPYLMR